MYIVLIIKGKMSNSIPDINARTPQDKERILEHVDDEDFLIFQYY